MPARTHEIFSVLADEKRLRTLLVVLDEEAIRPNQIERVTHLDQSAVSRALAALARVGLVARGNQRTPYVIPQPREARRLVMAAAEIEHRHTGNPDALALAQLLRRQEMARGAEESRSDLAASDGVD